MDVETQGLKPSLSSYIDGDSIAILLPSFKRDRVINTIRMPPWITRCYILAGKPSNVWQICTRKSYCTRQRPGKGKWEFSYLDIAHNEYFPVPLSVFFFMWKYWDGTRKSEENEFDLNKTRRCGFSAVHPYTK